jgi:hypothetical protein
MPMYYALGYKGKPLSSPMLKDEAEAKLIIMERCVRGLELIAFTEEQLGLTGSKEDMHWQYPDST